MGERSIFMSALDKQSSEEREAYVEEACGPDHALRRRVAQLLALHQEEGDFLDKPAVAEVFPEQFHADRPGSVNGPRQDAMTVAAGSPDAAAGGRIGPYKLLQKIGEGGMGVVYMAEQERPVRRRVALKIIKPGMDSAQVIARFEAERQALALMDHANIARVFDAGATDAGRPYFVMELVQGVPVTKYCDENQLDLRQRLGLFVQVCHAIRHAHQKGVIHRDIKPSNVMVTLCDGVPVPKVIDFGIAKATEQRLTERTLFTHYGMMVGTLEYMSPEQAELSSVGVDTRGDVYSLGVLLYELLTGSTPLERERLREAAYADVLKRIREEEPPRPSTRLGTSGEMLATISSRRRTEPQKLTRLVRGELDWIVMRCLEKDRSRRYETVNGLARDVERYLADEPVSAGPPGARYRLGKFARRNKAMLATTSLVAASLLLGTGLATWGLVSARRDRTAALDARAAESRERQAAVDAKVLAERQRALAEASASAAGASAAAAKKEAAKSAAVTRFLRSMFASARPSEPGAYNPTVRETLDKAVKQLDEGQLASDGVVEAAVRQTIGSAYVAIGEPAAAEAQLKTAMALQKRLLSDTHPDVATTLHALGVMADARRWWGTAVGYYREALAIRRKAYGEEHELVAATLGYMADSATRDAIVRGASLREAEALHAQAAELNKKLAGQRGDTSARSLNDRAVVLEAKGDYDGAEALRRQALAIYLEHHGERHHSVGYTKYMLAYARLRRGDDAGAEPLLREAVAAYGAWYGPEHPRTGAPLGQLRRLLMRRGDAEAATVMMQWLPAEVARLTREIAARPEDYKLVWSRADLYARLGRFAEATADWEAVVRARPDHFHAQFCAGVGRLHAGETEGYRAHVRSMMQRHASSGDGGALERTAVLFLLNPAPADEGESGGLAAATRLVDRDLALNRPKGVAGWAELAKAMAEYRDADFEGCLLWLQKFRAAVPHMAYSNRRYLQGTGLALEAMAHHRLARTAEAARSLNAAQRLMEQCPKPGEGDLGDHPERWQVWAMYLREARDLLAGGSPAPAPAPPPAGAIAGKADAPPDEREAARVLMELYKARAARLTEELKAWPDNARLVDERAILNGRLGRFADAAADWELKIKLNPDDWHAYYAAAAGRLQRGEVEAYRQHARAMVVRFANLGDWSSQERVAKTYALSPPPDAVNDLSTAMRLIDQALEAREHDEATTAWLQLTKALVEYRAGNAAACLEWTLKSRANNPKVTFGDRRYPYGSALALAAMAHHRLGNAPEARQAVAEAGRLMAEAAQPGERDLAPGQENWQVWAVLLREARDVVGEREPAPAPPHRGTASFEMTPPRGDPDAPRIEALRVEMVEAEVARLTAELKARPGDANLAKARSPFLARLGRFAEATADVEVATATHPEDTHSFFCAAIGRLHAGDVEAYRVHGRALLDWVLKSNDALAQEWAAKVYLLAPPPGDGQGVATAMGLIDGNLATLRHESALAWADLTKALAEYRAGNFAACLEWLATFRSNAPKLTFGDRRNPEGTALALAAMGHHRLGRPEEARRYLAESERLIELCPRPGEKDLGPGPENRQVWEILLREARALLAEPPQPLGS